jgi:hypothetical protein
MKRSLADSRIKMWRFSDISGTDRVPTFRVVKPKPLVWFWFYQAINKTLKMGTQSVPETSENLHILTWLSARKHVIELRPLANRRSTKKHNTYQLLYIYSIPPDDGLQICPKHVEVEWRNNLRINSSSSWFLLHRCIEIHDQQTYDYLLVSSDSQNTAVISLHNLKWSVFVTKARSASCAMTP